MFLFPDREDTGDLPQTLKTCQIYSDLQGCHITMKTRNLDVYFSRHREFAKKY